MYTYFSRLVEEEKRINLHRKMGS